jgi:hypothetical protein
MATTAYGQVIVAAAGTPARATSNLDDPARTVPIQSFMVQVRPENTGLVYVFQGGANFAGVDDRATRRRCLAILPAPADAVEGPFHSVSISQPVIPASGSLSDIWLDVSVSGNGAIISATTG